MVSEQGKFDANRKVVLIWGRNRANKAVLNMPHINANIGSGYKNQRFWYQQILLPVGISFKMGVKNENQ